eukprot:TRINITY_DN5299_c2_g1_i1.p1 TRINITY_DN5299_c2_g1~~TRINITY_DN5299_c2_g1_i1.p1  ORF type:complete len:248 (-),score=97.92 TRINITY_DN5299_c2_g1_i1:201-875(-)
MAVSHVWNTSGVWKDKQAMAKVTVQPGPAAAAGATHVSRLLSEQRAAVAGSALIGSAIAVNVVTDASSRLLSITAVIPDPQDEPSPATTDEASLLAVLQLATAAGAPPPGFLLLQSKKPRWSAWQGCHTLCFERGAQRVREPSRKNISVVLAPGASASRGELAGKGAAAVASAWDMDDQQSEALRSAPVVLQMGKLADDYFSLDFNYPLSPFQAFVLAMSAFDG